MNTHFNERVGEGSDRTCDIEQLVQPLKERRYFSKSPSDQERMLVEKEREISILQQKVGQLTIECDWLKKKSDEIFGPNGAHRTCFQR